MFKLLRIKNLNLVNTLIKCQTNYPTCAVMKSQSNWQTHKNFCSSMPKLAKAEVEVTFIRANGERIKAKGKEGDSLLDVIVNNNIDFDGFGACEGTLTCSTCHLIFTQSDFDKLPDKPGDEELDMLDLAYDLTDTSRLGCQINLTKDMNGLEVRVPTTVNDARS